jgi:hypothetical protein
LPDDGVEGEDERPIFIPAKCVLDSIYRGNEAEAEHLIQEMSWETGWQLFASPGKPMRFREKSQRGLTLPTSCPLPLEHAANQSNAKHCYQQDLRIAPVRLE